jgi:cold shock CspA family protein
MTEAISMMSSSNAQAVAAATSMMTGTIKRLADKYGFIRAHDGCEYFFLPRAVEPKGIAWTALSEGAAVVFAPMEHERGLRAARVRMVA